MSDWDNRANDIFADAIKLRDEDARRAFIENSCQNNAELRRAVDSMLIAFEKNSDSFLQAPATQTFPIQRPMVDVGSIVDKYKLLQQIGAGGFGEVYMAQQQEPVKRKVALKIIKLGMDTREVIARFEAERQALAMMDHPNIAKVMDGGITKDGRPYFVMELVKGAPITEYCDDHQLSMSERLRLLCTVCKAVQHAHQRGVIHRDIKPPNVLVASNDNDEPVPIVIDFGIAKAINQEMTEKTLFTRYGQMIGTPHYMSPEQANVNAPDVDTRSDVYSLGILLYELLTGTTPVDIERLKSSGYDEMLRIIREEDAPPPSRRVSSFSKDADQNDAMDGTNTDENETPRDLHASAVIAAHRRTEPLQLVKSIRGELDWITLKCLRKDRRLRYASPADMADDIERYLNNEPVEAAAPSNWYRFSKFVSRNRTLVLTSGTILAALLVATVLSSWFGWVAIRRSVEANEARQQLSKQTKIQRQEIFALDMYRADQSSKLGATSDTRDRVLKYAGDENADLRDITWRHLRARIKSDEIYSVPGGRYVSASADGRLVAYVNVQAKNDIGVEIVLRSQQAPFNVISTIQAVAERLCLSPDGNLLAGTQTDGVKVWSTATGEVVKQLMGAGAPIRFSPDGKQFVMQQNDIVLLSVDDWSEQKRLSIPIGTMGWHFMGGSIAFTPDSRYLIYPNALPPKSFNFYDVVESEIDQELSGLLGGGAHVQVSPDGEEIAYSNLSGDIRVFDMASRQETHVLDENTFYIWSLAYSPDGKYLLSGGGDQLLRVWDTESHKLKYTFHGQFNGVHSLSCSADGKCAFTGTDHRSNDNFKIWPLTASVETTEVPGIIVGAMPDGTFITQQVEDKPTSQLIWWDRNLNQQRSADIEFDPAEVSGTLLLPAIDLSCDGKRIAFGRHDGSVVVWNTVTEKTEVTLDANGQRTSIGALQWHPLAPNRLVSAAPMVAGDGGQIAYWDIREPKPLAVAPGQVPVRFSPQGDAIAAGTDDDSLQVYKVNEKNNSLKRAFADVELGSSNYGLGFDVNGQYLAYCRGRNNLAVLDLQSGDLEDFPNVAAGGVDSILHFDNRTVVYTTNGQAVQFWDIATGTMMVSLPTDAAPYGISRIVEGESRFYVSVRDSQPTTTVITIPAAHQAMQ